MPSTYKLRKLNSEGIKKIKDEIYSPLTTGVSKNYFNKLSNDLDNILQNKKFTEEYLINGKNVELEKLDFISNWNGLYGPSRNLYDFIYYLKNQIDKAIDKNDKPIPVLEENGVYTWLTFFYLYLQIEKKKNGIFKLSVKSERFILDSEDEEKFWNSTSYRHMIFSLLNFIYLYPESKFPFARTTLAREQFTWGDVQENTFARSGFVAKNPELVKLLDRIYIDHNKSDFDKNIVILKELVLSKSKGLGGVLRNFIKGSGDIRSQLDMKWAFREFTADEIREKLPDEEFGEASFLKPRKDLREEFIGTVKDQFHFLELYDETNEDEK